MKHRDSNETGHVNVDRLSPELASLEGGVAPLNSQDYGTSAELQWVAQLHRSGSHMVTATRKVDADGRYVVEFQAVRLSLPPSMAFEPTAP